MGWDGPELHRLKRQMRLRMRMRRGGGAVENRPGHLLSAPPQDCTICSLLKRSDTLLPEFTTIEACFLCERQQKVFLLSHKTALLPHNLQ